MKKNTILIFMLVCGVFVYSQSNQSYSAVNPALFLYKTSDVHVNSPTKYNEGKNIIKPNPQLYPWESRLENGMPNIIRDSNGNLSIYISSFISYAAKPPSKVGVLVYTNNSNDINNWVRPNGGLYWYNPNGGTADEKISTEFKAGFKETNIVAVDIESVGIYDDEFTNNKPIKIIYLPQRESFNKMIGAYEMDKTFTANGVLSRFADMKANRISTQKKFTFDFINGDTHMNFLKQNGKYYFVSRLNAKRSSLLATESLPLNPDKRYRYRRETISEIGETISSKAVSLNIALDMSTHQWEPYSMQPFRLKEFGDDLWWGLVTMFGAEADPDVKHRQRTELAISNDGFNWRYVKAGTPFLDNGTNPTSDDYGCINIGKPVLGTKFSANNSEMYYFYAASNKRHVEGRNPGISLAIGKYGKMAGLKAEQIESSFYSMSPVVSKHVTENDMIKFSPKEAFTLGNQYIPFVLADISQDPKGKTLEQLASYVNVSMYAYSSTHFFGKGSFLGGVNGSSIPATTSFSDEYERVPYQLNGKSSFSKENILAHLRDYSAKHPSEIISIKEMEPFPIVLECKVKNAVFYGLRFQTINSQSNILDTQASSNFKGGNRWTLDVDPTKSCTTDYFLTKEHLPNQKLPTEKETGSLAIQVNPKNNVSEKCVVRLHGDDKNNIGIYYSSANGFTYRMVKDGLNFAQMNIKPSSGQSFDNKECVVTIEAVKSNDRKYGASTMPEEATVFRVSCPELKINTVVQQSIIWNWKHDLGNITPSDSANARAFAYLSSSAFIAGLTKITVGAENEDCRNALSGLIKKIEIAEALPKGSSDFWDNSSQRTLVHEKGKVSSSQSDSSDINLQLPRTVVQLYPIPVRSNQPLYLRLENVPQGDIRVKLYDNRGGLVKKYATNVSSGTHSLQTDISNLRPGFYLATIEIENSIIQQKIIIQ